MNGPTFAWKAFATYNFPLGFQAGWFYHHESRDRWTPTAGLPRRLVSQGGKLKLEPLGSHRQPSTDIVDMHLEKQFQLSKHAISAMVDISNVFNLSEVSAVDTKFQDPTYGKSLGFTAPRTFRGITLFLLTAS